MSTNCLIGIRRNNIVKYIYCHNDGYIENGVGDCLVVNYEGPKKIERLMELGDISCLGKQPISLKLFWDTKFFNTYFNDQYMEDYRTITNEFCQAYKDRGEISPAKTCDPEMYSIEEHFDACYIYLFDADETYEWYYKRYEDEEWKLVKDTFHK